MVRVRSFRCVTRVHTARARHRRVRAAMPGRDVALGFFFWGSQAASKKWRGDAPERRRGAMT